MTIATTTAHADWSGHAEEPYSNLRFEASRAAVSQTPLEDDDELAVRIQRLMQVRPSAGDPTAHHRMAAVLFRVTGWDVFAEGEDERAYVSRLWAEDWDSPEDAIYDTE